jgi:hypothetical protein
MSVTKRRRMVESIDRKMQQLNVLGLLEVEILVAMTDDMQDFHYLMTHAPRHEMDAFLAEYDGFFKFAKIIETLAEIIEANKIKEDKKGNYSAQYC